MKSKYKCVVQGCKRKATVLRFDKKDSSWIPLCDSHNFNPRMGWLE